MTGALDIGAGRNCISSGTKQGMLEIAVSAVFGKHDLSGFEVVDASVGMPEGFEAWCRRCGRTAWVGIDGVAYNLLGDNCGGR
jgi:hypothetical protein